MLIKELYKNKEIILNLAKNDFKNKYITSNLGIVWGFAPSLMTIVIYWFIFSIGFKVVPVDGVPYLLWIITGLIPWFFFSEVMGNVTNCFSEYSYLVKKVVFKVSIIPLVKIISALFIHIFFLCIVAYICLLYGIPLQLANIQLLYYTFCLVVFSVGVSLITSSINVLFRDMTQIVGICLQFGIWLLPILWNTQTFDNKYIRILKLNPLYYIVQGYRDTLIYGKSITSDIKYGIYFWCVTIAIFVLGTFVFKRLKPHFADVL